MQRIIATHTGSISVVEGKSVYKTDKQLRSIKMAPRESLQDYKKRFDDKVNALVAVGGAGAKPADSALAHIFLDGLTHIAKYKAFEDFRENLLTSSGVPYPSSPLLMYQGLVDFHYGGDKTAGADSSVRSETAMAVTGSPSVGKKGTRAGGKKKGKPGAAAASSDGPGAQASTTGKTAAGSSPAGKSGEKRESAPCPCCQEVGHRKHDCPLFREFAASRGIVFPTQDKKAGKANVVFSRVSVDTDGVVLSAVTVPDDEEDDASVHSGLTELSEESGMDPFAPRTRATVVPASFSISVVNRVNSRIQGDSVILIDTGASVSIFRNPRLLTNLRPADVGHAIPLWSVCGLRSRSHFNSGRFW